jgi:hypothetical protein
MFSLLIAADSTVYGTFAADPTVYGTSAADSTVYGTLKSKLFEKLR